MIASGPKSFLAVARSNVTQILLISTAFLSVPASLLLRCAGPTTVIVSCKRVYFKVFVGSGEEAGLEYDSAVGK